MKIAEAFNKYLTKSASLFTDDPLYNYNHNNVFFSNPVANDATWGALLSGSLQTLAELKGNNTDRIIGDLVEKMVRRPPEIAHIPDEELIRQFASWPEAKRQAFLQGMSQRSKGRISTLNDFQKYLQFVPMRSPVKPLTASQRALRMAKPIALNALLGAGIWAGMGALSRAFLQPDNIGARITDTIFY